MKKKFQKPRIVVSKCLEFDACRYNGQMIPDDFVKTLKSYVNFIPVCPEVEIGLGVPRKTIRIERNSDSLLRLIQPETNLDLTEKMEKFSNDFLHKNLNADGFIMKNRSPSCAVKDAAIHTGKGKTSTKTAGFFTAKALQTYPELAIEEEGRLRNIRLKEHFLIRVFAYAEFRNLENTIDSINTLYNFHAKYKLILMAYNQKLMREMGKYIAQLNKQDYREGARQYRQMFYRALATMPRLNSHLNVLMHCLGYFKQQLSSEEKAHFLDLLNDYSQKKIPLTVNLQIMRSWIIRFHNKYLDEQAYFHPFPFELLPEVKY